MNHFVEFTLELVRKKDSELGIKTDSHVTKIYIKLISIIALRPSFDDDYKEDGTCLYLESGEEIIVNDKYSDIVELITR